MEKQQRLNGVVRGLLLALILCVLAGESLGYTEVGMSHVTDPQSGISMECGLPLEEMVSSGYFPLRFRVHNRSNEAHTWRVTFTASGGGMGGLSNRYTTTLTAEAGQSRSWDLLVPRADLNRRSGGYISLYGDVEGYGVNATGRFQVPVHYSGAYDRTNFAAISETLGKAAWSKVEAETKTAVLPAYDNESLIASRGFSTPSSGSRDLHGSQVKLDELPPDWRTLSGVAGLWLSTADWEGLSSDRRRAVQQWVAAGGHLFVASQDDTIERLPLLATKLTAGTKHPLGFGWIKAVKLADEELQAAETAREIIGLDSAVLPAWQEDYGERWELAEYVGWPKLNVPLILIFVGVFATVIGPVNLRLFAPPQRRARLFFTVPLLSVGASIVLFAVIALGDGFGGVGARNVLLYIPAGENYVTVVQEQVARSRLLFGRYFELPETVQMSFVTQEQRSDRGISLERSGDVLSGDWFRSRSVQAHVLRANVPSRAAVSLQQGGGPDGAPPVLLSSVASPLRELHYIDASGRYWRAEKVETGRPVTLKPSTREALDDGFRSIARELSINLRMMFHEVEHRPGHFYAVADPMPEGPIETLPSIRWQKQNIVCFGSCTGAESK